MSVSSSAKKLDMTTGSVYRNVLVFAFPLILANILQQLYSTVDTLVISNYCGTASLAAVGTATQPVEILLCVFMGLGAGVSILAAQYVGAKDMEKLKSAVRTSATFLYVCAIPLTAVGMLVGPWILRLMQVPDDTMPLAFSYIEVLLLGTLGSLGYNINAGILRGVGDSNSSLFFLLISSLTNIVLDVVFVAFFKMDVAGAALATIIAQYLSWIVSAICLKKKHPYAGFTLKPEKMDKAMLKSLVSIALPLGLNHSFYSVGHVVLQLLINTQGSVFMAGCSIASKMNSLANVAINSLSSAACTFSGQNFGAKKYRRLCQGAWRILVLAVAMTMLAGAFLFIFAPWIVQIFGPAQDVADIAVMYTRINSPFFWCFTTLNIIINFANGMGVVRYTMAANIIMLWGVRIPVAIFITNFINGMYVMAAYPISFFCGMLIMLGFFFTSRWREVVSLARTEA